MILMLSDVKAKQQYLEPEPGQRRSIDDNNARPGQGLGIIKCGYVTCYVCFI